MEENEEIITDKITVSTVALCIADVVKHSVSLINCYTFKNPQEINFTKFLEVVLLNTTRGEMYISTIFGIEESPDKFFVINPNDVFQNTIEFMSDKFVFGNTHPSVLFPQLNYLKFSDFPDSFKHAIQRRLYFRFYRYRPMYASGMSDEERENTLIECQNALRYLSDVLPTI